jgi:hypothetical protein
MKATTWKAVFAAMNPSPVFETIAEFAELRADHRFNCAPGANRRRPWLFRGHAERGRKESEVRGNCGNHIDYWLYPLQLYGVVKRHQKQARSDAGTLLVRALMVTIRSPRQQAGLHSRPGTPTSELPKRLARRECIPAPKADAFDRSVHRCVSSSGRDPQTASRRF